MKGNFKAFTEKKPLLTRCVAAGLVAVLYCALYCIRNGFFRYGLYEFLRCLCDGCTLAGALFLSFGTLKWIRNDGFFDGFMFFAHNLFNRKDPTADYALYKAEKKKLRTGFAAPLYAGLIYIGASLLLLALLYII